MNKENKTQSAVKLVVYFEDPFWIGVFERNEDGKLSACKVTFGSEPKEYDVQQFIKTNYYKMNFSPSVEQVNDVKERLNPKRMQRIVHKQLEQVGIGTKSQQALKLQHEQMKITHQTNVKKMREEEQQRMFELKQQKRKQKHRGH